MLGVLQAAHSAAQHLQSPCRAFRSCDGLAEAPRQPNPPLFVLEDHRGHTDLSLSCPQTGQMTRTRGSSAAGRLPGLTQLLGKSIPWELSRSPRGCPGGEHPSRSQSSTRLECRGLGETEREGECWLWKQPGFSTFPHDSTASPKLCKCCREEPQVPSSFLPGAERCSRSSPSPAAALPQPPSPRSSLHPSLQPRMCCSALASSTIPTPHWGFPPDHPNGTTPSPSQQQGPEVLYLLWSMGRG